MSCHVMCHVILNILGQVIHRGYYIIAWRYEISLRVLLFCKYIFLREQFLDCQVVKISIVVEVYWAIFFLDTTPACLHLE